MNWKVSFINDPQLPSFHAFIMLPVELPSLANSRLHWADKARAVRPIREAGCLAVKSLLVRHRVCIPSCVISMTRFGRKLDDDNLATACKPLRDGIADALGINDRDKRIQWLTAQLPKAKGNGMGCSIDITGDTDESGPARSRYCPNCGMALCARDMELGRCQNCPSPKKELA